VRPYRTFVKRSRVALVLVAIGAQLASAGCGDSPDRPPVRSEVTISTESLPELEGTLYGVSTDHPLNTKSLTSTEFKSELVEASRGCDPGGSDSLSRRVKLSQTGTIPELKLSISVAAGTNTIQCARTVANQTVSLLPRSPALGALRRWLELIELRLTGTVSKRP